jgi:glycosyltransferase involved in cell wall biosynthesis
MLARRQRILFLNNQGVAASGGGVTILRELLSHLADRYAITLACFDAEPGEEHGFTQVPLPRAPDPYWRAAPILRSRHLAATVPPALLRDADLVVTLDPHFCDAVMQTRPRRLLHLSLSCTPRQETVGRSGVQAALTFLQYGMLERRLLRAADEVVVASRLHARELRRYDACPSLRTNVLYPVFSHDRAPPANERNRPLTVLAAGRLEPLKRFDFVVRLAAELRDLDCRFVIAGDGPELARLRALASGLPVTFPGNVANLAALLSETDIFVHPSRYESFGIVLFEAMRAGVASLCAGGRAAIGCREVMADGVETCVVDFERPEAARTLRRLAAEPATRSAMGSAGRKRAAELLAESYATKFDRIVERLVA